MTNTSTFLPDRSLSVHFIHYHEEESKAKDTKPFSTSNCEQMKITVISLLQCPPAGQCSSCIISLASSSLEKETFWLFLNLGLHSFLNFKTVSCSGIVQILQYPKSSFIADIQICSNSRQWNPWVFLYQDLWTCVHNADGQTDQASPATLAILMLNLSPAHNLLNNAVFLFHIENISQHLTMSFSKFL